MLLAACSSGDDGPATSGADSTADSATTSTATDETPSAYAQVLAQIREDGDVTLPTALQAFSLAYGELPGVSVPDGPRDAVVFGGGPLRWLERYWDDLTPEQQQAAVVELGFDPTASMDGGGAVASGLMSARRASGDPACDTLGWTDPPGVEADRATFEAALKTLGSVVGPLPGQITVRRCQSQLPGDQGAWASAHPQWGDAGYAGCVMYVYPQLAGADPSQALAIITHEAWHCYQASTAANSGEHRARPAWVIEGQAMWVGEAMGGGPTSNQRAVKYWRTWLATPGDNLYGRAYDAVGFWGTVAAASSASDALGIMLRTVRATGSDEAYYGAAVSGLGTGVENLWASRYFRVGQPPAWDTVGPGAQPASVAPAPSIETRAPGSQIVATARSAALAFLSGGPDLVTITADGPARAGDTAGLDQIIAGSLTLCLRGDRCPVELSTCVVFTAEDAQLLTPDVNPTPVQVEMIAGSGSGSCMYSGLPNSSSSSGAFILRRPSAELAAGDYPVVTGCTEDLAGVGDRAGLGSADGSPMGCLLKGRTILYIVTNGNAGALPEVLARIAARL